MSSNNTLEIRKSTIVIFLSIITIFVGAGIWYISDLENKVPNIPNIQIVDTAPNPDYVIEVGDDKIIVDQKKWKFVDTAAESIYSKNYSAKNKTDGEMFEQMITVFLNKMTDERKIGEQITDTEYIEAFIVHPNSVTLQIRVDKGAYWVMSRQTFKTQESFQYGDDISWDDLMYFISIDAPDTINQGMDNQIDNTRYILNNDF